MNNLSWMIYAAEICGRINDSFGFMAFMSLVFSVVLIPATYFMVGDEVMSLTVAEKIRKIWILPAILGPIAILTPSSNMIYMIAASEAGETIVTSPEAREVFNDLKTIIKNKLKEQLPKS